MKPMHFKLAALAFVSTLALSAPSFADDSDLVAIQKDNSDIAKHQANLAKHRADKAESKANGDWVGQASSSVAIGADHVMKHEKQTEKGVDQTILNNDK